mmetsp:Transcript_8526/g.12251  ORF Transcript_8526/g.12251 Transcript_8526/m.12251 type:complete len:205 (-) Transcript_8526:130-744(-)
MMKISPHNKRMSLVTLVCAILTLIASSTTSCVVAFVTNNCPQEVIKMFYNSKPNSRQHYRYHQPLFMTNNDNDNDDNDTNEETNNNIRITPTRNDTIPLLSTRLTRARLEHHHTLQFLKRPPLKLPYTTSQKWIQHNYPHIRTREEFDQLVSDGDIKNVYISKRPEEYYGRRGEWISWEHYLCGEDLVGGSGSKNGTETLLKWQ